MCPLSGFVHILRGWCIISIPVRELRQVKKLKVITLHSPFHRLLSTVLPPVLMHYEHQRDTFLCLPRSNIAKEMISLSKLEFIKANMTAGVRVSAASFVVRREGAGGLGGCCMLERERETKR